MNDYQEEAKEKFLVIAYKVMVLEKNPILLNILREKKVTFGSRDIYFYNCIIRYDYFLLMNDSEAQQFIWKMIWNLSIPDVDLIYK